ncbi:hypothetical protein AC791_14375 [Klebsiella sp. RIT-PI-d]|uniref:hypothetical protein n=1 Tax=Klebsiella sp. RIT-PI-d TaxID=1681196 RepID=UPI0006768618|nr:hypothetical protein [Klebsiella sp. RIT-PI-d]KNC09803.1 hypothetical protein AC791_14375 [Klebsiella sp. RIT-PI-d]
MDKSIKIKSVPNYTGLGGQEDTEILTLKDRYENKLKKHKASHDNEDMAGMGLAAALSSQLTPPERVILPGNTIYVNSNKPMSENRVREKADGLTGEGDKKATRRMYLNHHMIINNPGTDKSQITRLAQVQEKLLSSAESRLSSVSSPARFAQVPPNDSVIPNNPLASNDPLASNHLLVSKESLVYQQAHTLSENLKDKLSNTDKSMSRMLNKDELITPQGVLTSVNDHANELQFTAADTDSLSPIKKNQIVPELPLTAKNIQSEHVTSDQLTWHFKSWGDSENHSAKIIFSDPLSSVRDVNIIPSNETVRGALMKQLDANGITQMSQVQIEAVTSQGHNQGNQSRQHNDEEESEA